ncbi:MAG: hypothetical protein JXQ67_10485 [Campylobacterales bacterium]|nr:hypothetical protein [Campylobacterales bacterium]
MEKITPILEKYNNFKDAQIRSVRNLTDDSKVVTIVLQDDDGEDLNSVEVTFTGITRSRILENSVLSLLDMMSGVSIIKEHDLYGFALGRGTAMLHVHNAPFFIVSNGISIEEK